MPTWNAAVKGRESQRTDSSGTLNENAATINAANDTATPIHLAVSSARFGSTSTAIAAAIGTRINAAINAVLLRMHSRP